MKWENQPNRFNKQHFPIKTKIKHMKKTFTMSLRTMSPTRNVCININTTHFTINNLVIRIISIIIIRRIETILNTKYIDWFHFDNKFFAYSVRKPFRPLNGRLHFYAPLILNEGNPFTIITYFLYIHSPESYKIISIYISDIIFQFLSMGEEDSLFTLLPFLLII